MVSQVMGQSPLIRAALLQPPTPFSQMLPSVPLANTSVTSAPPPPPPSTPSYIPSVVPSNVGTVFKPAPTTQITPESAPVIKVPTVKADYKRLQDEAMARKGSLTNILGRDLLEAFLKDLDQAFWPNSGNIPNARYMSAYYNLANAMLFTRSSQPIYHPLTNAALEAGKVRSLRQFIRQSTKVQQLVETAGPEEYRIFEALAKKVEASQLNFVITDVAESVSAYHRYVQ